MPEPRHTQTSTTAGPDYCFECSADVGTWVKWPCRGAATAARLAEAEALLRKVRAKGKGSWRREPIPLRLWADIDAFLAGGDPDA